MQVGEYKLKMNHHKITVACMHALLKQIMCCEVPEGKDMLYSYVLPLPEHITDASSECEQKALLLLHTSRLNSFPMQDQTFSNCPPDPWPKAAPCIASMAYPYSSHRQTTSASLMSQELSQTVCHSPLR